MKVAITLLTLSSLLCADMRSCNFWLDEAKKELSLIPQFQQSGNDLMAKMHARSFQNDLINMRVECQGFDSDTQKAADEMITSMNGAESAMVEAGILKASSNLAR